MAAPFHKGQERRRVVHSTGRRAVVRLRYHAIPLATKPCPSIRLISHPGSASHAPGALDDSD